MKVKRFSLLLLLWIGTTPRLFAGQSVDSTSIREFSAGFNVGFPYANLIVPRPLPNGTTVHNYPGYRVGGYLELKLDRVFMIVPELNWSFNGAVVDFGSPTSNTEYWIAPSTLDMMVHLKYRSKGEGLRAFGKVGPNFRLSMDNRPTDALDIGTSNDLAIDLGFGVEKSFDFFVFSPEIRYSYGLLDVNQSPVLEYIHHHTVALVISFTSPLKRN